MCLVMTNPVDILAVRHVKQGIEAGGFRTGYPSNYYLLLSNPNILTVCGYAMMHDYLSDKIHSDLVY